MLNDPLTRRHFISALAASVAAVGGPLPIGFPKVETYFIGFDAADRDWESSQTSTNLKYFHAYESFKDRVVEFENNTFELVLTL